ncbi:MAG: FtsX-like permease family protein, partial [Candidatus Magasanikbacteria bacterium]|nr:FtsX-like permease family protein [Candidatus Magasanikbacteria bacterium]
EEVKEVTLFSRDEVLTEFTDKHKDNQDIISSIEELGENPFGPRMTIKTHETEDYATITEALSVPEYDQVIEAKTFADTEKTIQKIQLITSQVERFSALLSGLFGAIAFIVIFNTIRIAIYTQRTEISIKKLVGATDWFVKGPYMLSSLFFSLLSVIISFALTLLAIRFLDPYIMSIFNDPHFLTNYYFSHILVLAGIELGAVLILTILSSSLAMRKYLRV